jgi:hypothetical protein
MNKYAAEKIAHEYYNAGRALALKKLTLTKTAGMPSKGQMAAILGALSLGSGQSGKLIAQGMRPYAPGLENFARAVGSDIKGYGTSLSEGGKSVLDYLSSFQNLGG